MSTSSMLYTMGMALDRAHQNGHAVDLLVEGVWISGHIAALDGQGAVLETPDGNHAVARVERIAAVKIMADSPFRTQLDREPFQETPYGTEGAARPMPGPRQP